MRIDTDLMELATALYEEAAAAVGDGLEAERLAAAALHDLLERSRLIPKPAPAKPMARAAWTRREVVRAAG